MKTIMLTLVLAGVINAQAVYFTAKGKTYHAAANCRYIAKSPRLTADKTTAVAHGLKPCIPCYRAKTTPKADKGAWAKVAK